MKRRTRWLWALLALVLLGAATAMVLSRRAGAVAKVPEAKAPVALELASGDLVTVRTEELTRALDISGSLFAVNSAFVKARVAAEVRQVLVREGDSVRAGQLLAQLDTTEYDLRLSQAEHQAEAARAQLEIAQRTLQNNTALVAQGFISATGLQQSAASEAGAQATLLAAQAGVALAKKLSGDATITAPIGGQIAQRLVQPGERVPVDAKLLEIVDLSKIELQASVAADEAAGLRLGAAASLKVDGIAEPVRARVARINPSAQAGSRSVLAYLELEPHPGLRQGLFARGTIEVDRRAVLVVPLSALRTDQSRPYALRVEADRVRVQSVELGARGWVGATEMVEVLKGLSVNDQVLVGSVGALGDGTAVRRSAEAAPGGAAGTAATSKAARAAP